MGNSQLRCDLIGLRQDLIGMREQLHRIERNQEKIMTADQEIQAVTADLQAQLTTLTAQNAQLLTLNGQVLTDLENEGVVSQATIAALQAVQAGFDTAVPADASAVGALGAELPAPPASSPAGTVAPPAS
jgi:hypothetical protein